MYVSVHLELWSTGKIAEWISLNRKFNLDRHSVLLFIKYCEASSMHRIAKSTDLCRTDKGVRQRP